MNNNTFTCLPQLQKSFVIQIFADVFKSISWKTEKNLRHLSNPTWQMKVIQEAWQFASGVFSFPASMKNITPENPMATLVQCFLSTLLLPSFVANSCLPCGWDPYVNDLRWEDVSSIHPILPVTLLSVIHLYTQKSAAKCSADIASQSVRQLLVWLEWLVSSHQIFDTNDNIKEFWISLKKFLVYSHSIVWPESYIEWNVFLYFFYYRDPLVFSRKGINTYFIYWEPEFEFRRISTLSE